MSTRELMTLSRFKVVPAVMWFVCVAAAVGLLLVAVELVTGVPSPAGSRLSYPLMAGFFLVIAEPFAVVGLPVGALRLLQSVRVLPVLWIRERDGGLVFAGVFDRLVGGGHLVARDQIDAFAAQPAGGYQKLLGKAVMFRWRLEASGKTYSWLSPRDLVPDATERLRKSLESKANGVAL